MPLDQDEGGQQQRGPAEPAKGFPPDFQLFPLEGDQRKGGIGLNTKAQRPAIGDQDAAWIENYLPIGIANTRALFGAGTAIFNAATVVNFAFYNIAAVAYAIVFKLDGSAVQVRLSDSATTTVGAAGTFYAAGNVATPTIVQWAAAGILIVSKKSADAYWAWDGTLYGAGAASPAWLNGGTPTTMPSGISGTDIEVFLARVWIIDGPTLLTSVASNGANFATGAGGAAKPNTESTLRRAYTALCQINGYLYVLGDSSVAYVTNVQTSATPTTSYQFTVIDAQVGTPWRDSVIPFGRTVMFANANGVYAIYGSSANKVSDDLDGIWDATKADFTTVVPSSSVATLFGIKVFMITLRTLDPTTQTTRTLLAMWNGRQWFMGNQAPAPSLIAPQEIDSVMTTYGCNGTAVQPLFTVASASLEKKIVSKLWGGAYGFVMQKQVLRFYTQVKPVGAIAVALTLTVDSDVTSFAVPGQATQALTFVNSSGAVLQFQNNAFANLFFQSLASIAMVDANGSGLLLGLTITTTSPDFILERAALGYKNLTALY